MHDDIEYVHEHNLPALLLGLLSPGLKGSNWRLVAQNDDETLYDLESGNPVEPSVVRRVTLHLYDMSLTEE